jgi:hypothetical protein
MAPPYETRRVDASPPGIRSRRLLPYARCVWRLAILVAAVVVAAPAAAGTSGRELPVTDGRDGAPGSLRQLVEQVAKAGDSIVFPTALRVELRRKLTIRSELAGLTIDGSTATGGSAEIVGIRSAGGTFVEVTADRVTLRALKLTGTPVVFPSRTTGGSELGPAGTRVVDVEATGSAPGRSGLELSFARGFLVRGGRIANGIDLTGTDRGRIVDVTLAAKGKAIEDADSKRLVIEGNTLESGRVVLRSQSVRVDGNEVRAGGTIDVWIHAGGSGRVSGNELAGGRILAQAGGTVEVARNTLAGAWRGGAGLPGITIGCATDGRNPNLSAVDNTVRGMRVGVSVQCNRDVPVVLRGNVVEESGTGISAGGPRVTITGGSIRKNRGVGIRVRAGSQTTIRKTLFGGNGGLAIDRRDARLSSPRLRYDGKKEQVLGVACPRCAIDLYGAEAGKEPGEGIRRIATVRAAADGSFRYPPGGTMRCATPTSVTALATDERRRLTSEFAVDVTCEQERPPDCRARFVPAGFAPGTIGASGGTVRVSCAGVGVKLVSVSAGSGGQRIASHSSPGRCETPGSKRSLQCYFSGANRGREVALEYTTDQPFASTTLHVLAGGTGAGGTTIVLRQTFFFNREGMTCSQTMPPAPACATL